MPATFVTSDTHFGHVGATKFLNHDGSKMRPWDNVEEMDEAMVDNWNRVVRPKDLVYHLGDVVINRRYLNQILPRLNGRKKLVRGNHDVFRLRDYTPHFEDILGVKVMEDCIMSHIPLHRESITSRFKVNVHGHTHGNKVLKRVPGGNKTMTMEDDKYICVCVEQWDFTPVNYETLREIIRARSS